MDWLTLGRWLCLPLPPIDPSTTAFFQELYDQLLGRGPARLNTMVDVGDSVGGGPVEWLASSGVVCINR